MTDPVTLDLSVPVQAHGETVARLSFRAPTGRDIRAAGLPYRLAADGEVLVDAAAMHRMIVALAAVPPSTVDAMAAADWQAAMAVVLGFFGSAAGP